MRGLRIVVLVIAMLSCTACANMPSSTPTPSEPRSIILNGEEYNETSMGKFVSWRCKDYINNSRTLVELGTFANSMISGSGFVLYDGGHSGEPTDYARKGVNQRWDWGTNEDKFSFIINPDGTGRYYDFSSAPLGERRKPSSIYKCSQKRA